MFCEEDQQKTLCSRATFIWSLAKLVIITCIIIPLSTNIRNSTCTALGGECTAFCSFDEQVTCERIFPAENPNLYQDVCTSANSESITNFYRDTFTMDCSALVRHTCYKYDYLIILGLYLLIFSNQLVLTSCFTGFDPQQAMVDIALKLNINSSTLTTLLHPSVCLASVLEAGAIYMTISIDDSHATCDYVQHSPKGIGQDSLLIVVLFLEAYSPVAVHALDVWLHGVNGQEQGQESEQGLTTQGQQRASQQQWRPTSFADIAWACVRLDLWLSASILRAMQVVTWPVSILSYFSVLRLKREVGRDRTVSNGLLAMDIRQAESFSHYALSRRRSVSVNSLGSEIMANTDKGSEECNEWLWVTMLRTLFSRYTVRYSFAKLVASVVISLILNNDYIYCGNPNGYLTESECPISCSAHCVFEAVHHSSNSQYLDARVHGCNPDPITGLSSVHQECMCDNWVMTDMLAMVFNSLHFILQCYYLIHYNNFDPQQNQIDCVQSYTFVGDNITLFLTHPALCFLSVLESAVLIVSWNSVMQSLGIVCSDPDSSDQSSQSARSSVILFAVLMTLIEVYKANMTVATNAFKQRRYVWAAFSLIRLDLFVFYGSTLFLQTFLFPFSIIGYLTTHGIQTLKWGQGRGEEGEQKVQGQDLNDKRSSSSNIGVMYTAVSTSDVSEDAGDMKEALIGSHTESDVNIPRESP